LRHIVWLVLASVLLASVPPAMAGVGDGDGAAWVALPGALNGMQAAFLSNNAARIARLFCRRAPVLVSLPPLAEGWLAPGPMRAFLDRLVRDRISTGFELPARFPSRSEEEAASAFVRVKWTHRAAASDTLQVEYLHLALRYTAEDSEWQIVEMRTSMR
jgi:hypothetical protein